MRLARDVGAEMDAFQHIGELFIVAVIELHPSAGAAAAEERRARPKPFSFARAL